MQILKIAYRQILIVLFLFNQQYDLKGQDIQISQVAVPFANTTISGLAQDNYGNIWIASNNQGLYKYNSDDFKLYNHQRDDENTIISDRLECIYAAKNGIIWIGSFANGLSRLDPIDDQFTNFVHDADDPLSIRSNGVRRIAEDQEGRIWVSTLKGLDYYDPETQTFHRDFQESEATELLSQAHIRTLYLDRSGILWAGASSPFFGEQSVGGLFRIDPKELTVQRYFSSDDPKSLNNDIVTAIYEDSRGVFWVGTAEDGLHTMDRELGVFQRHLNVPGAPNQLSRPPVRGYSYASDHIRFILEDKFGRIWIGTMNNGINLYDPRNGSIIHLTEERDDEYGLPINDFWSALRTEDGLLWFGAWSPGDTGSKMLRVNLSPIHLGYNDWGAPIYSFVDQGAGTSVYMGSSNSIIRVNERDEITNVHYLDEEEIQSIDHLSRDGNSNLWGCTDLGLLFYNPRRNQHKLYSLVDDRLAVGELLELTSTAVISPDSILVSTNNGLFLFDPRIEEFERIEFQPDIDLITERAGLYINLVYVDSKNRIWVGFGNYGLYLLENDLKTFKSYRFLSAIQDGPYAIREDKNGRLFVGNWRSGLKLYREEQDDFLQLTDRNGLLKAESRVTDLSFITDSTFWLVTNAGLIDYNMNSGSSSLIELKELEEYEITSDQFFTSINGFSYVGTSYGFIKYKPEEFDELRTITSSPRITKIFTGDQNITSWFGERGKSINLKHDQNDLSFGLSYIDFISGSREKKIEYQLAGYEDRWRDGKNDEEVYYYKLPHGKYSFQVRKLGSDGNWKEDKVDFQIHPPWWLSWWAYCLYALGGLFLGWLIHRSQKARTIRKEREKARERELAQAKEIEKAYDELKATQTQLIHAEKMASLGELTAGIAHEIKNPLNFVNNFSEVNEELIEELIEEIENGDFEEVKKIASDIKLNEGKIQEHGRRADSIVKGMLMHSRASSDERIPTDINALCDEYMRLSYHGLRARDKSFNAEMSTDFDTSLKEIMVVRQDLGRVLLNLFTNAFYTVDQKRKKSADTEYQPLVSVRTQRLDDRVRIEIGDNGQGMKKEVSDKIFQPFFTTKPTGEGTGLGLSISYDIITKGHDGSIEVQSKQGKGTQFIIEIPETVEQ